jgi:8-oxo-dGTP pyrophosphatase MutT (NUDIX family)
MSMQNSLGVINHDSPLTRKTDYLYRISLKCLGRNEKGEVLVVKETGHDWWDLPGGGMDHGEDIKSTIVREMKEEVNLEGDFDFKIIDADEPAHERRIYK